VREYRSTLKIYRYLPSQAKKSPLLESGRSSITIRIICCIRNLVSMLASRLGLRLLLALAWHRVFNIGTQGGDLLLLSWIARAWS